VHVVVSKEYATGGAKLKFVGVIRSKIGPALTTKNPKAGVVRIDIQKCMEWGVVG
jgi:hypothetical protein